MLAEKLGGKEEKVMKRNRIVLCVMLFILLAACTGCQNKTYWDYEYAWVSEQPYVCISGHNFYDVIVEVDGTRYEFGAAHANDGRGMSIYDRSIDDGHTQDAVVWEVSCKLVENELRLTIEEDNRFDYAGKTIVLHQATEEVVKEMYPEWYDEEGKLEYPLTMDDPEWKSLPGGEGRIEVCQIPEEILQTLTTEEVLYMVKMYPHTSVHLIYDSKEEGYRQMQQYVNVIQELESREDYIEVVLKEYIEWEIPLESAFDYDKYISKENQVADMNAIIQDEEAVKLVRQDNRQAFIVEVMEMILASEKVQSQLSDEEMQIYIEALAEKEKVKEVSEIFTN